jgi:hypothetical protein
MVPVRFPADQHARLREWCAQHGFSMATVIRGLVAKFLEDQRPEHNWHRRSIPVSALCTATPAFHSPEHRHGPARTPPSSLAA